MQSTHQPKQHSNLADELYSVLVGQALPDALFVHDHRGRLVEVNQRACESLGYAREELLAMNLLDLDQDLDLSGTLAEWSKIQPGAARILHGHHRRKNGSTFPVEVHVSLVECDGERFYVDHVRDITDRKSSEDALSLQALRAKHLIELPLAAEELDEVDFMQHGQELAEQLTGSEIGFIHFVSDDEETIELVTWSRRTLSHYCQAISEKHYPVSEAGIWAEALRRREPVVFNDYASAPGRRGLPPGHAELKRIISVPVVENDAVVMLAGVGNKPEPYTDVDVQTIRLIADGIWRIVQRRRSEAELRRLSMAVAQSPEGVIIANANTSIEYVNPAFLQLTGHRADQVLGESLRILSPGMSADAYSAMWQTLAEGKPWKGEFHNRRIDGTKLTESALVTPICQPNGRITHYLAVLENITEKAERPKC